ncbi:MAG: Cu(I)/Ag(I) efflux system membrane fusion protein [Pseudomonadales bacterium]|jgi:Cu(I)/Ag(I) efflux system membrane fusion protein
MKSSMKYIFVSAVSLLIGFVGTNLINSENEDDTRVTKKPAYWVAPMDANYRRDQPGKSPMGMDLIPVYKNSEDDAGVVRISPEVINNLGVRTALARKDVLTTEIKTVGYVKYDEDQLKHIHPRVEGWVEKLYVKAAGDPVKKGQPLYNLYSPQLVNAQEEYLLALSQNNQSLISASKSRLHALQLSKSFIKDLQQSRTVKQTVTFNSPQDGVVDKLNIREGFFVQPGTTLMSIGNLDQVWVEVEVFERQASLVREGLAVTMKIDYLQGRVWEGDVDYLYPTLDPKNRTARARLRFDNADKLLKPNMFTEVVIHRQSDELVVLVPRESVIRTGEKNLVVLALGDGRFKSVAVKIGDTDDENIAIKEGVLEGDSVVVSAQFLLDSESSKNSDFLRMNHEPTSNNVMPMNHKEMKHSNMDDMKNDDQLHPQANH